MAAPTSVDDYLAALPDAPRAALEKLRKTIKAAAPQATETISYQMPAFKLDDRFLVSYAAFKNHCSLFREQEGSRGARGRAEALLLGEGDHPVHHGQALPTALVRKIVKARIEENADLTRR